MKVIISKNLKLFKDAFGMLANCGRETSMVFDKDGVTMITTSANSVASKATFKAEFFDEYTLEKDTEEFSIVLQELAAVIKKIGYNSLTMEGNEGTLSLQADKTKFVTPLLYEADTIKTMPVIEYSNIITTNFGKLGDALAKMALIKTDSIKLYLEGGFFRMKTAAQIRKVETDICEQPGEDVAVFLSKDLFGRTLIGSNEEITISIDNDKPVRLLLEKNGLSLETVIAPRINEEY